MEYFWHFYQLCLPLSVSLSDMIFDLASHKPQQQTLPPHNAAHNCECRFAAHNFERTFSAKISALLRRKWDYLDTFLAFLAGLWLPLVVRDVCGFRAFKAKPYQIKTTWPDEKKCLRVLVWVLIAIWIMPKWTERQRYWGFPKSGFSNISPVFLGV